MVQYAYIYCGCWLVAVFKSQSNDYNDLPKCWLWSDLACTNQYLPWCNIIIRITWWLLFMFSKLCNLLGHCSSSVRGANRLVSSSHSCNVISYYDISTQTPMEASVRLLMLTLPCVFHMLSELHGHGQPPPAPGPTIAANPFHSAGTRTKSRHHWIILKFITMMF
jgi:hypothetical protein